MNILSKIGFGPKVTAEIVLNQLVPGKIVILTGFVPRETLEKAGIIDIAGLVVGSLHFRDYDSLQKRNEYPLLVLNKFGNLDAPEEFREKLKKLDGKKGTLDGEGKSLTT